MPSVDETLSLTRWVDYLIETSQQIYFVKILLMNLIEQIRKLPLKRILSEIIDFKRELLRL